MNKVMLSLGLLATSLGQAAPPPGQAATAPPTPNLVAVHDPDSPQFRRDCLSCHQEVLHETSTDLRVAAIHRKMIPYTPGFNPRRGVTQEVCLQCHRAADVREGSGAGLRVQVDRKMCALCHGPSGPGKVLYR
ncbi:MAG: hypothetical protein ACUVRY_05910 [Thermoanaerobaculaceae bacterium]